VRACRAKNTKIRDGAVKNHFLAGPRLNAVRSRMAFKGIGAALREIDVYKGMCIGLNQMVSIILLYHTPFVLNFLYSRISQS
jgi:hypothetical protein